MKKEPRVWQLVRHSYQIADTGDYDGRYEITDGKTSIFTDDDDEEALQAVVEALNNSDCSFYTDNLFEIENRMLKDDVEYLKGELAKLRKENEEQ